jgi:predicted nucleic acid-binding protein
MSMAFLLDTNVVSELRRSAPHRNVVAWRNAHARAEVFLSVLVVGEIRQGIERLRLRDPARADALDGWLNGLVRTYGQRILPITHDVAQAWGHLNGALAPRPVVDGLIAATALIHRLTVATRNVSDFEASGVAVVNPFEPEQPRGRQARGHRRT